MNRVVRSALAVVGSLSLSCLVGCASARPQHLAGGTPRPDPRGVPIGGTSLAFQPNTSANFIGAASLGAPGSGAFAGSGPGKIEAARAAATGRKPPAVVREVPPPAPVLVVPVEVAPSQPAQPEGR